MRSPCWQSCGLSTQDGYVIMAQRCARRSSRSHKDGDMSFTDPTIHVYANGHGFVVVPVLIDAAGHEVEGTPANLAALTLGRPTTLALTKALRSAREQSAAGQSDTWIAWDGDNGKWWAHHLFRATIVWHADAVVITSEPRGKALTQSCRGPNKPASRRTTNWSPQGFRASRGRPGIRDRRVADSPPRRVLGLRCPSATR